MTTTDSNSIEDSMGQRLFFSVGEPSGDLHASNLIRCLQKFSPSTSFRGFGGARMIQAGLDLDFDLTSMAVMGITEVLPRLREFFKIADMAEDCFRRGEVDGVVLVDFPGFNWHIAKRAKKYGLPVFYYLPPQLWAWGGWRVQKMRRYVDHVLCNLPFEKEWFESHGVTATYVGHPFFDAVAQTPLDTRFMARWRDGARLQVAVLPGSRDHEVHRIWPLQLQILRKLSKQFPELEFLVATLKDSHALWCRSQLTSSDLRLPIHIFAGKTSEILELSDITLMKSGSVSLEVMARGKPAVVMYHVSQTTYALAKLLVHCKSISLPNLIADEILMPEFISHGSLRSKSATKSIEGATDEMSRLIHEPEYRSAKRDALRKLAAEVAKPGATDAAARWILSQLNDSTGTVSLPGARLAPASNGRSAKAA
ncbi:MAG: lipid-A-disaccharide synthase [Planctomycetes bacterium]|nr:lipid-A-disaccharide synthase [Planctomycetota bacterium]